MSGQIRGKIDCLLNSSSGAFRVNATQNGQSYFKNLYDFFTGHPNATLIARHNGAGGSPGTNYYDQTNPFGNNAWFVVRLNATAARPFDTYHLFQWCGAINSGIGASFGASPGSPGLIRGSTAPDGNNSSYVGYQCAIGLGGTGGSGLSGSYGNPWNGTGSLGTNVKGTPVWVNPPGGGTGVMVWPRSNNLVSGTHATNKENCMSVWQPNSDSNQRHYIVADDDSFVLIWDVDDANQNYLACYSGLYVPRTDLIASTSLEPYVVLGEFQSSGSDPQLTPGVDYGDLTGTSNRQGGIITRVTGSSLNRIMRFARLSDLYTQNFEPNHAFAVNTYDEFAIQIAINENTSQQFSGYMGQIEFIRETFNVPVLATKSDFSRAYFGGTSQPTVKLSIPWDTVNNTVPKNNNSRIGITFVNP